MRPLSAAAAVVTAFIAGAALVGVFWLRWVIEVSFRSQADQFSITVLEVRSGTNEFSERIRVRCQGAMEPGFWVTDLSKAGFFETSGSHGEVLYREGRPRLIGFSSPVRAEGEFSTCELSFHVSTTGSNTIWQSEGPTGLFKTTLRTPLLVHAVQTNWPGHYQRGSDIPLADLGPYKIMLLVK